jgi:hypothetical protein
MTMANTANKQHRIIRYGRRLLPVLVLLVYVVATSAQTFASTYLDLGEVIDQHPWYSKACVQDTTTTSTDTTASTSSSNNSAACCTTTPATPSADSTTATNSGTFDIDISGGSHPMTLTVYVPSDGVPHPLILFAPGQSQDSKPNDFYGRYLKAMSGKGFVVAGINFGNNTSDAAIPGEAKDITYIANNIVSNDKLKGRLSTGNIGLLGHSDGGIAALIAEYAKGGSPPPSVTAVMVEDARLQSGYTFGSGPALFVTHGTSDTIEPSANGVAAYNAITPSYKALALFVGADHHSYITGGASVQGGTLKGKDLSVYNPAVDAVTSAYFSHMLGVDSTGANLLSTVAGKYTSQITFSQKGAETPAKTSITTTVADTTATPACCGSTSGTTNASTGGTSTVDPGANAETIYNYLVGHGLKNYMAAAIMGNIQSEAGYDPTAIEPYHDIGPVQHGPEPIPNQGFGIVQWTPPSRQQGLVTLAHAAGKPSSDLDSQTAFIIQELNTGFLTSTLQPLLASTNVVDAEKIVEINYEAHANQFVLQPPRLAEAQHILTLYGTKTVPPATSGTMINATTTVATGTSDSTSTCSSTASGTEGTLASGTVKELAQKLLDEKNVTYDPGMIAQIQGMANGVDPTNCGIPTSTVILGYLVALGQTHKVQVSNFVDPPPMNGAVCGSPHASGCAVDIDFFDGNKLTGQDPSSLALYKAALAIFPTSQKVRFGTGGSLGSGGLSLDAIGATGRTNVSTFGDNPNSVHTDLDCWEK